MGFLSLPTLNDLEEPWPLFLRYFTEFGSYRRQLGAYVKPIKQNCSPIKFFEMAILAIGLEMEILEMAIGLLPRISALKRKRSI